MRRRRQFDVCASSASDLPFDARVWKEAKSLTGAGFSVALKGYRFDAYETDRRMEEGVEVLEIPAGPRQSGSALQRAGVLLRIWLDTLRTPARIYHAHNVEVAPACWLASRLRGAKLVYDAHEIFQEPDWTSLRSRIVGVANRLIERMMFSRSDRVITTNPSRARVFERAYGRHDIVTLANVPHRSPKVEPLDPGYPKDTAVLLYQGHIATESRAFRETLEALTMLDGVDFVVLGYARKERLELLEAWARELAVEDRVHLLPPRPFGELVRTAAAATVGLVPIYPDTLNSYLGDTNKIFEYLMAGIPVVASDFPEIRRVARDGDPPVGEVFDPYSAVSIARAVRDVLDDPLIDERRREARRLALEKYNWGVEERALLALYDTITPNGASQASG